jgi:hypothetical protein
VSAAEPPRLLDELLEDARVLGTQYAGYDPPTPQQRIARARARRESEAAAPRAAAPTARPEHEQAWHELDLASTLVLNTRQSTASLARLVDDPRIDPEGALVFACLLHLARRQNAARFWWQFAAGGGNSTAAYCLYLDHRCHAEFRDAEHWLRQADQLRQERRVRPARPVQCPVLPDHLLRDLLRQCHHGRHPDLPVLLEGAVNRLAVAIEDTDFGEIARPSPQLASTLAARRSSALGPADQVRCADPV